MSNITELTSTTVRHQLKARELTVKAVSPLGGAMRRFVLGGDQLEPNFPFYPLAPIDHVKLAFPHPETGTIILPEFGENGPQPRADGLLPLTRDYSVRKFDAETKELTIDFVLHDHGPAGRWASHAKVGDPIGVIGPRGSRIYSPDFDSYVFLADLTGVPALCRWLEEIPSNKYTMAVVGVDSSQDVFSVHRHGQKRIQWHYPTDPTDRLLNAVKDLDVDLLRRSYIWGGGEASELARIRRYLVRELGLDPKQVDLDGYWKIGVVNRDHHQELEA